MRAGWLISLSALIAAVIGAAPAAAAPQCEQSAPGTTRCATSGSVQISTTPTPTSPYIRYGCTAGYTTACFQGFTG